MSVAPLGVAALKERANEAYGRGEFKAAIELSTQALETAPEDTPVETKRQLLSNRAQSYLRWGDIYDALHDTETALSALYTLPDSDAALTAKCLFRRAKLLYNFARYEEARAEYEKFKVLWEQIGNALTPDEKQVLEDIEKALKVPPGSKVHQKADLIRALDHRGIILQQAYRSSFPYPPDAPPHIDPASLPTVHFASDDERACRTDPLDTPLVVPFSVRAPNFPDPTLNGNPFAGRTEIAEDAPEPGIGAHVSGMLKGFATSLAMSGMPQPIVREAIREAVRHEQDGVILAETHKGRLRVVPPETTLRQLWAGMRDPQVAGGPGLFEDLRTEPRVRPFEVDGIGLVKGWLVELLLIPRDDVPTYLAQTEFFTAALNK
ncbi:hypothetical protein DENSPDRAFT_846034 [Dentipellis sp. KUC8613]|nr:hypothetical protein DENSPDRAFT_846034 [Dentipellis sp. KUC8613]